MDFFSLPPGRQIASEHYRLHIDRGYRGLCKMPRLRLVSGQIGSLGGPRPLN